MYDEYSRFVVEFLALTENIEEEHRYQIETPVRERRDCQNVSVTWLTQNSNKLTLNRMPGSGPYNYYYIPTRVMSSIHSQCKQPSSSFTPPSSLQPRARCS